VIVGRPRFQILAAFLLIGLGVLWLLTEQGLITRDTYRHLLPLLLVAAGAYFVWLGLRATEGTEPWSGYRRRGRLAFGLMLVAGGLLWWAASYGWIREGAVVPMLIIALGVLVLLRQSRRRP
jgi:hypothetical protein